MSRECVINFKENWDYDLALIEFSYNNRYDSSIQMAPSKAIYGRRCRSSIGWCEVGESRLIGLDLVHKGTERLKMAHSRQKSYTDVRRRELDFKVHDWVYLNVPPMMS